LILDEPAASLDPLGRKDVLEVMERLRKYTTIFYSTHILDDVQQVSDTVAILNHGELVAHGPIEELLMGSGGTAYRVRLRSGDLQAARSKIESQEWVSEIQESTDGDQVTWIVAVSDTELAETRLLRLLLADEDLVVTDFRRREYELEEIFINIVEGGEHG
jgi:ABC-2 type transport system ATP-binding protein